MPTAPVVLLGGSDVPDDSPTPLLPPLLPDNDVHDIPIHPFPDTIPVLSIHGPMYYSSFPDFTHSLTHPYHPHDTHIPHSDLHFALSNSPFGHDSPHISPKHLHHSHDLGPRGPSSIHDARFHSPHSPPSLSYLPPLHDLACSVDYPSPPFAIPSPPPKPSGLAHTLLPPIVQSNPADLSMADIEASLSFPPSFQSLPAHQNRSTIKRTVASSPPQVDPCAAAFLRDRLGEAKWNTFSARLFERRLGPIKSKIRVRGKNSNDDASPLPGATAIDFLIKVEVVKEVLRTYVPYVLSPFFCAQSACSRRWITLTI